MFLKDEDHTKGDRAFCFVLAGFSSSLSSRHSVHPCYFFMRERERSHGTLVKSCLNCFKPSDTNAFTFFSFSPPCVEVDEGDQRRVKSARQHDGNERHEIPASV